MQEVSESHRVIALELSRHLHPSKIRTTETSTSLTPTALVKEKCRQFNKNAKRFTITTMIRNTIRSMRRAAVRTIVGGGVVLGVTEWTTKLPSQGRSSEFYHDVADNIATPILRRYLDPEGRLIDTSSREFHFVPLHRI